MKTCIKIYGKNGEAFIPSLQFEYSDIQEPVVIERENDYVISYYKELGYDQFDISDPWPCAIHCDILADVRGYVSPQHICAWEANENMRFEDVKDDLPPWAYMKLSCVCHGDVFWHPTSKNVPDGILYIQPCSLHLGEEYCRRRFIKHCLRLLNGEQLYEHVTIEIDKKTREHDFFGMVAYLWEEECTTESLKDLNGEPCNHELIDIQDLFTFY
jgi:hypothetical protein